MTKPRDIAALDWPRASVRVLIAACILAAVTGCTDERAPANEQTSTAVLGQQGQGSNLQRFEVRRQGRLLTVQVFNRGEGARTIAVAARSYRGLDRSDARAAYDAAFEVAQKIDCSGGPMAVFAETALFQEEGRRSAFTTGESAWLFQGRCG